MNATEVEREYDHYQSVFKNWKPDTKTTIAKCVNIDLESMNLVKLVKNDNDMQEIV